MTLWLVALLCYWWPRRLQPKTVGLAIVVVMIVVGGVLTTASLAPCRSSQTGGIVAGWVLDLYVGNPPSFPLGACKEPLPLAYQFGSPISLGATLTGALAAAAVLWRQPLGRLRARLVRDATVLTGLDTLTMPLLQRLAQTRRRGSIVVIEPDGSHPMLAEARATGARVMIADPTSSSGRIDDPRHADHWRGRHSGTSGLWFEDAVSPQESTACALVNQIFHRPGSIPDAVQRVEERPDGRPVSRRRRFR